MDILLIYPPYESLMGLKVNCFPIGLGHIATLLKGNNYKVGIYNAEDKSDSVQSKYTSGSRANAFTDYKKNLHSKDHEVWNKIENVLSLYRPKIVGITSYAPTHSAALKIAEIAKGICSPYVIIGGPYPTLLPEEACQSEYVDYVVSGEGEYTVLELTDFLLRGEGDKKKIRGTTYKENGKCISNPPREHIKNLDELPLIDHDLLFYSDSRPVSSFSTIMGSRGCSYRCTFCASVPIWGRHVRYRSTDSLIDEIGRIHARYKNKSFRFFDDTFMGDCSRAMEFCSKIIERKLHRQISWSCLSRVNTINKGLVEALERSSCNMIAVGVESGSERILKTLKKDITKKMVREKIDLVKRSKLLLHLYFMIGTPYETEEDIIETCEFIKELKPDSMNLCTFTPYYGTELYNICVLRGLLPKKHDVALYENIGHHNRYNYFCSKIPKERYIELVDMALELSDRICDEVNGKKIFAWLRNYRYYLNNPKIMLQKAVKKLNNFVKSCNRL